MDYCGALPGTAKAAEVADVGGDGFGHGAVFEVLDVAFEADLLHDLADLGVVDVRDAREEVVLDLEVEAADQPCDQLAAGGEVGGGGDLVDGVLLRQEVAGGVGEGEVGVLDGVGELEDDGEGEAGGHGHGDEAGEPGQEADAVNGDRHEDDGVKGFAAP